MKNLIFTLLVFGPFLVNAQAHADENLQHKNAQHELDFAVNKEDGLTYKMMGKKQEDGVLRLFVRADSVAVGVADLTADQANAIAPSAGVQFKLKF